MKIIFSLMLLFVSSQVFAVDVEGANLEDKVQLDTQQVILNGTGLRKKLFFKVYAAGLYLTGKMNTSEAILADAGAKRMAFHLLREVSGKQMLDAINEAMPSNNSAEEMKILGARLAEFSKMFAAVTTVNKGDVINFDYLPSSGTRVTIAGVDKGRIEGADFMRALLKVWIGDKPVQENMKQSLLGK